MYLKDSGAVLEMAGGVAVYCWFDHHLRIDQALDDRTPAEVHFNHEQVVTPSQPDEQGEEAY